jgi:hypothetical protein
MEHLNNWQAITRAPLWSPDENELCAESFLFSAALPALLRRQR